MTPLLASCTEFLPPAGGFRGSYKHGASLQTRDGNGLAAFLLAAGNGILTTVQLLIEWGVDITQTEVSGSWDLGSHKWQMALLLSTSGGYLATVQWLLSEGVARILELDADKQGATALLRAAGHGMLTTVQSVVRAQESRTVGA
jgi:hypothetical protein